ncbi:hypothetical protein [Botrimarina sp.]|uniref:hypothetical protein n=1 Tax=Botrimarina sp. TaxID=2795802 RepID=UPI0032EF18E6
MQRPVELRHEGKLFRDSDGEPWNRNSIRLRFRRLRKLQGISGLCATTLRHAAAAAHDAGKRTVLGGMIPVDHHWLRLIDSHHALDDIDVVAIHGFPGMWWPDRPNWDWFQTWRGWGDKVRLIAEHTDKPIWITETGLATWDFDAAAPGLFAEQSRRLAEAAAAPAERVYWYSAIDLARHRDAIEGFHVDENEYHLGLGAEELRPKPAATTFQRLLSPAPAPKPSPPLSRTR